MTPVEAVRAAAVRLRELAGAATPGPWRDSNDNANRYAALVSDTMPAARPSNGGWGDSGYGGYLVGESITSPDRALIAALNPIAAGLLAAWLDATADAKDGAREFEPPADWPPLVLARHILGPDQVTS